MHRCYHPKADWSQSCQHIQGEEAHHALKVMRLRIGDSCEIFDGRGTSAQARITSLNGSQSMSLQIEHIQAREAWAHLPNITLALAIPKGSNMDLIVQKAVELGVTRIVPLITQRTIVRLKEKEKEAKQQKWQRTVLEACKQSGVSFIPQVEQAITLKEYLARDEQGVKLCCAILEKSRPMRDILEHTRTDGGKSVSLLIGPEGDFSGEEYQAAEAAGYAMVSLGPIILRVETAVFMAVAQVRYALD